MTMTDAIVQVNELSHRYAKDWAIEKLTFEIPRSGIMGLLGSNGAGKSTFMNILCGVLRQTEGQVLIDGIDMRQSPLEARRKIGFLPQKAPLYDELTVHEYLRYSARLRGIEKRGFAHAVAEAMDRCGVAHFRKRLIGNLSGGYRQRVGIAQAIVHNPKLVVLDEPTSGLDPNQVLAVRELIREIAKDNAVILSTHILSEVQVLCREILMIESGRIVFNGSVDEFNEVVAPNSIVLLAERLPAEERLLTIEGVQHVEKLTVKTARLTFEGDRSVARKLIETGVSDNWGLTELRFEKSSLDDVFAKLSGFSGPGETQSVGGVS